MKVNADDNDTTVSTASVTVQASCSMTATIETAHTANIPNGIYSGTSLYPNGIGKTNIATFCNDNGGYAIYAIGYTGDKYEGEDHTKLIGATNGQKIATGTATSGNISNWAMKLTKVTDSTVSYNPENLTITNDYDDYNVIPNTYTKVANYASTTDQTLGSVLSTTYAAYISPTEVADTYTGKVKYTLVHPNTEVPSQPQTTQANKICYYANASSAVGTMGCQSISASATSATLLASNFSRAGYGFAGWSDAFDYATNPNANFYGPQEYITFTAGQYSGTDEGLSLYAVWVKSEGSLQDSSKVSSVCGHLTQSGPSVTRTLNSVSALTDQRDNETYAIAKLADGNCWMIENLRLESTNSDNSTGALAQGYGTSTTYGNFSGLASAENANFSDSATANSLYYSGTQSDTASVDIGTTNYPGYRMPRYNNYNHQTTSANRPQNPTANDATNSTTSAGMYSYGNYYTWAAAMANTGYYNTTTADANGYTPSEAANTSICPKGWKLPYGRRTGKGATSGGFSNLDIALGGTGASSSSSTTPTGVDMSKAWRAFPNNFLYSGYFSGSSASRGSYGNYWSSTTNNFYYSYYLHLDSSGVTPGTNSSLKYYGDSIRCVASSS